MSLTRTGLGVVVASILLGAAGLRWEYLEAVVVAAAGLIAVLSAWLVVQRPYGLEIVQRAAPRRVPRSSTVPCRLVAENVSERGVPAVELVDRLLDDEASILLPRLAPGERSPHDYVLYAARRGVHQLGPIATRRRDLLGLVVHRRDLGVVGELVVHPIVYDLTGPPGTDNTNELEQMLRRSVQDPLAGFHSMREYVAGDDTRTIHWPTTAKTGKLMVREFIEAQRPRLTVVLDTAVAAHTEAGFEEAVDVAASIAAQAMHGGLDVVVRTNDARFPGEPYPVRDEAQVLELLARISPTVGDETLSFAPLMFGDGGRDALVVVTGPTGTIPRPGMIADRLAIVRVGAEVVGRPAPNELTVPDAQTFQHHWGMGR